MDRPSTRVVGVSLLVLGALLVPNELYLEHLLPYPTAGDGFDLSAYYHSLLSMLGFLAVGVGVDTLRREGPTTTDRALALAVGAVVAFAVWDLLWSRLLVDLLALDGVVGERRYLRTPRAGGTTAAVEFLVALLFALGVVVGGGSRRGLRRVAVAFGVFLSVQVAFLWVNFNTQLYLGRGPHSLVGLLLAVPSSDLLGLPLAGAGLLLCALVLGFGYGRLRGLSGPEPGAGGASDTA